MNSFDDMNINSNELNDIASLKKRIDDMNTWIDHLDEEIHSQRRRLWCNFEDFVNESGNKNLNKIK